MATLATTMSQGQFHGIFIWAKAKLQRGPWHLTNQSETFKKITIFPYHDRKKKHKLPVFHWNILK